MSTDGLTVVPSVENGAIIKCMAEEFSPGSMAEGMKVTMWMTRSKVTVYFFGRMVVSMWVNGSKGSSMGKVPSWLRMARVGMENGVRVKGCVGWMKTRARVKARENKKDSRSMDRIMEAGTQKIEMKEMTMMSDERDTNSEH